MNKLRLETVNTGIDHGEAREEITVWIEQTRHAAARLRVFMPEIAATLASGADEVEERLAQLPPPGTT